MDIREIADEDAIASLSMPGRRGMVINAKAISKGVNTSCVLSGYLTGTDAADLISKLKTFTEVINSAPEPLVIDTGDRTIRVRKQNVSMGYPPSGAKTVRVAVTFISEDGCWEDILPVETRLASVKGYPVPELEAITVSGACETYPTIIWRPTGTIQDPCVTWYGKNLVKDSSFSDLTTDWTFSGSASIEKFARKKVARVAADSTMYQSFIPCIPATVYYFSAYIMSDTASTARFTVSWYNSGGTLISSSNIDLATTTSFVRMSDDLTSPGATAYCKITLCSTVNGVFVFFSDIQAEENTSLSEYMPSQEVQFAITGNTQLASGDFLEVDMDKKTVRYWDGSLKVWTNWLHHSNATFFHLNPGKNLLAFYNEADVASQILIRFVNRYLAR